MNRRDFLKTTGLGAAAAVLPLARSADGAVDRAGKPNIIFVMLDDASPALKPLGNEGHRRYRNFNPRAFWPAGATPSSCTSSAPQTARSGLPRTDPQRPGGVVGGKRSPGRQGHRAA